MQSSKALLLLIMLTPFSVKGDQPWDASEVNWLLTPPQRPARETRTQRSPEHFAAVQADGTFIKPRYARDEEARLLEAVARQDAEAVKALLKQGANPNARNYWRDSPLLIAVRADHAELAQVLLDAGAEVNVKGLGYTPLGLAARNGSLPLVRLLLKAGANPDRKNDDGDFPIHGAVLMGHTEVVSALLGAKPDLMLFNREGLAPLALAAALGDERIAVLLLKAGAPIEWGDNQRRSPLWWALYRNRQDMARLLVEQGAQVGTMSVGEL